MKQFPRTFEELANDANLGVYDVTGETFKSLFNLMYLLDKKGPKMRKNAKLLNQYLWGYGKYFIWSECNDKPALMCKAKFGDTNVSYYIQYHYHDVKGVGYSLVYFNDDEDRQLTKEEAQSGILWECNMTDKKKLQTILRNNYLQLKAHFGEPTIYTKGG